MPDDIKIFCNSCRQLTRHDIHAVFEEVTDDGQIIHWHTIQCRGCDSVSFLGKYLLGLGGDNQEKLPLIYPVRIIRKAKQFDGLQAELDQIYREMIDAFNNGGYILCAGGLRALVEGICAEQRIFDGPKRDHETNTYVVNRKTGNIQRGKTLDCKIEGLAERNILTNQQAQSLHEHRYLGNKALHELEIPTSEMLEIAINIIEHVMDGLYNIPTQVGNLARMRAKNQR